MVSFSKETPPKKGERVQLRYLSQPRELISGRTVLEWSYIVVRPSCPGYFSGRVGVRTPVGRVLAESSDSAECLRVLGALLFGVEYKRLSTSAPQEN